MRASSGKNRSRKTYSSTVQDPGPASRQTKVDLVDHGEDGYTRAEKLIVFGREYLLAHRDDLSAVEEAPLSATLPPAKSFDGLPRSRRPTPGQVFLFSQTLCTCR